MTQSEPSTTGDAEYERQLSTERARYAWVLTRLGADSEDIS